MAAIHFTSHLQRYLRCPSQQVAATTLADALQQAVQANPALGSYLFDDQGGLRRHVTVFIDGQMLRDRVRLSDPLRADSRVYVMQALSGG